MEKIFDLLQLSFRERWAVDQLFEAIKNLNVKGMFAGVMVIFELLSMLILGTPLTPRGEELDLTGYELVFEDEFEGDELDLSVWDHRGEGSRRGGANSRSQVDVRDGNLVITGEYLEDGAYGAGWYTAAIKLKERYKQGYFEIKCKVNKSQGYWSAFWIQADGPYTASISKGGVGGAELDIFESAYDDTLGIYHVTHAIHCAGVDGVQEGFQSCNLGGFYANDPTEEYNTYGLKWTEDEYIFYINGVESIRSTFGNGVSEVPEDVIVSLEIPEIDTLNELDKDTFKTEFVVDYVRIYQ